MWTDSHCHLDAPEFDADRSDVVRRARAAGVAQLVLPAVEIANFDAVRNLAHEHGLAYALGIHPLCVAGADPADLDVLAQLLLQRERLDVNQRFDVMRMIFGGHVDAHDHHIVGLNEEFLAGYLYATGFVDVRRVQRHGIFRDTSDMVFAGTPIGLNLYGVKCGGAGGATALQGSEVMA